MKFSSVVAKLICFSSLISLLTACEDLRLRYQNPLQSTEYFKFQQVPLSNEQLSKTLRLLFEGEHQFNESSGFTIKSSSSFYVFVDAFLDFSLKRYYQVNPSVTSNYLSSNKFDFAGVINLVTTISPGRGLIDSTEIGIGRILVTSTNRIFVEVADRAGLMLFQIVGDSLDTISIRNVSDFAIRKIQNNGVTDFRPSGVVTQWFSNVMAPNRETQQLFDENYRGSMWRNDGVPFGSRPSRPSDLVSYQVFRNANGALEHTIAALGLIETIHIKSYQLQPQEQRNLENSHPVFGNFVKALFHRNGDLQTWAHNQRCTAVFSSQAAQ